MPNSGAKRLKLVEEINTILSRLLSEYLCFKGSVRTTQAHYAAGPAQCACASLMMVDATGYEARSCVFVVEKQ